MKSALRSFAARFCGLIAAVVLLPLAARAIPELQLYIEGATYDPASQTWVYNADSSGKLRLWAIGNVSGPGNHGNISNVKLAVAYDSADQNVTITLTPDQTGGYGGFTDPSPPPGNSGSWIRTVTDGSAPTLSNGSALPSHDVYGLGTSWQEFKIGNFKRPGDSPIADFTNAFPTPGAPGTAVIDVFDVTVTGTGAVHFDLYDSIQAGNKAKAVFAPFSHDAEATIPDGGATLALLALGLLGLRVTARKS